MNQRLSTRRCATIRTSLPQTQSRELPSAALCRDHADQPRTGLVWVGRPLPKWVGDRSAYIWQMPQGGITAGEEPRARGLARAGGRDGGDARSRCWREAPIGSSYELPEHLLGIALKGRYRGQRQKWFAMRFTGDDSEIDIAARDGHKAEFDAWRWARIEELPDSPCRSSARSTRRWPEFAHLRGARFAVGPDSARSSFSRSTASPRPCARRRPWPRRASARLTATSGASLSASMLSTSSMCWASTVRWSASTSAKPPRTNTRRRPPSDLSVEHAGPQRRDDGRVAGQHRELPLHAGHDHLLGVLRHQDALGRHQLELERACHESSVPFLAMRSAAQEAGRRPWRRSRPRSAAPCRRTGRRTPDSRPCWARSPRRRPARPTCRACRPRRRRSAARTPASDMASLRISQQEPNL